VEVTKKNENAKLRTPAKNLNFGIAYGMGPWKLYEDLNAAGFPITFPETKVLFRTYCDEFRVAVDFLRSSGRLALEQGYLANLGGRRRYWIRPNPEDRTKFPLGDKDPTYQFICSKIEREGGNAVIQSVNADMTKQAMVWIRDHIKKHNVRAHFVNQVYDEIVTESHKDDSPDFVEAKRRIMIEAGQKYLKKIPIEVDGHVAAHWIK
jgi:DNA polymerase-1